MLLKHQKCILNHWREYFLWTLTSSNSPTFGNVQGTNWWRNLSNWSRGEHSNQIFESWQGLWGRWYLTENVKDHDQLCGLLTDLCVPSSLENWLGTETMADQCVNTYSQKRRQEEMNLLQGHFFIKSRWKGLCKVPQKEIP